MVASDSRPDKSALSLSEVSNRRMPLETGVPGFCQCILGSVSQYVSVNYKRTSAKCSATSENLGSKL